ncbi:MAG: PAS domain-containing protein [Eubacteriales bacterium]|nr:PAS domain-containing protein [Eubacteriales bacterium]
MDRYRFCDEALAALEMLQVPLVVYQSLDRLTVAVAVSQGFRDLLEYDPLEEAYRVMEGDLFSNTHPDDAARVAEAARRFIEEGENYEVIYRFRRRRSGIPASSTRSAGTPLRRTGPCSPMSGIRTRASIRRRPGSSRRT